MSLTYNQFLNINEDYQERLVDLQEKRELLSDRIILVKKNQQDSLDKIKTLRTSEAKTTNPLTKKIYSERIAEEGMKQQYYSNRLILIQQRIKIIEKQINIIKLRQQSKSTNNT